MPTLDLTLDELLTTTRAVRKRLDLERPVEMELIRECLDITLQAPSGSNAQGWHFVVVTDSGIKTGLGDLYRQAFDAYRSMSVSAHALAAEQEEGAERRQMERIVESAEYLAANMSRVPILLIPCVEGRVDSVTGPTAALTHAGFYGSILPAAWNFMLAARTRGLGTAWTTLHLMYEEEAAELLGIPYGEITQTALIPVAHTLGTKFKPALRKPLDQVLHVDAW